MKSASSILPFSVALLGAACAKDDGIARRSIDDPLPPLASELAPGAPGPSLAMSPSAGVTAGEYVLAFSDEFDAQVLAADKWFAFDGDPHHRDTINSASKALAAVREGSAFLSAAQAPAGSAFPYAAGYVDTHGLFAQTYGRIEFRARCQYAPGVWYALWGRAWADLVPEIDVEFLAENTSEVWLVNHWALAPLPADQRRGVSTVDGADITLFHTYTIVWKPDLVEWLIDGKPYRRVTEPQKIPHEPMFWVMNAWVGGWGGTPTATTKFPANIEVDYLRIYRWSEWATAPLIRIVDPRTSVSAGDLIVLELADFEVGAHVEVREGETVVETLKTPPFRFAASHLKRGAHRLTFVGADGVRSATTSLDVTVE
jgi:beta-glucanase (GH16 family)